MPSLNWDVFKKLPGADTDNFELVCRNIVWLHYGKYGDFKSLRNQPGVEFHLNIHSDCALGSSDQWFGWQCKWYQLNSSGNLYSKQKSDIIDAIEKTKKYLPDMTDWILCTQDVLSKKDQEWFYGLTAKAGMKLQLWSKNEIESLLNGPAIYLRNTYFGDLVLTPDILKEQFRISISSIRQRWIPDVHQVTDVEIDLHRMLLEIDAWDQLLEISKQIKLNTSMSEEESSELEGELLNSFEQTIKSVREVGDELIFIHQSLRDGEYSFELQISSLKSLKDDIKHLLHQLRKNRYSMSLPITNLLADINDAIEVEKKLLQILEERIVTVVADAGYGKTQMAAQLTEPTEDRPAGILLHGCDLHAGKSIDTLANRVKIYGKSIENFDALIYAVNAAGERAKRRLPIIIDGLNEAEDPRDWKNELASLEIKLKNNPYVLIVCTLRKDFVSDAIPENINKIEMNGFEEHTIKAIKKYFRFYKINLADVSIPLELLGHPLTLRIFCEATNPGQEVEVGVEKIPGSLIEVFALYIEQVAEKIVDLSAISHRYYKDDIYKTLNIIGLHIWENNCRSINMDTLRELLGEKHLPWDKSIVRHLEQEGLLLRASQRGEGTGYMSFAYDALAGYIAAKSLLENYDSTVIQELLNDKKIVELFLGDWQGRHPLAGDIFEALVGLFPKYNYTKQLFSILDNPEMQKKAIFQTAWLDKKYLDDDTVKLLSDLIIKTEKPILFGRLKSTRSALNHPLNSEFLDNTLRKLPMNERDLKWTEWVRSNYEAILKDLEYYEKRWRTKDYLDERDYLIAKWFMWTLTSTVRLLRDQATKTLYWYGARCPEKLFELTIESLSINDPYVSERMLASSYGVTMSFWADESAYDLQKTLPKLANSLMEEMFVHNAAYCTHHTLKRDYALGIIELARKIDPKCIATDKLEYLIPPFSHFAVEFKNPDDIQESDIESVKNAIFMDFGNYTLGRLIPNRPNYDFDNEDYKNTRKQIEYRMKELGYSDKIFQDIDRKIGEISWRIEHRDGLKIDRYGKKYSWISYFEMYGLRQDEKKLPDWRNNERTSDVDIDPSFPELPKKWHPELEDIFVRSPSEPKDWIANGSTPNYNHLLEVAEIDGNQGPWVLLNGYIEQSSHNKERKIFTFLWGRLVEPELLDDLIGNFLEIEYPGNHKIPEPGSDVYTYAGEIPWSKYFADSLRNTKGEIQRDIKEAFVEYDGTRWKPGIPVEVPVYKYNWESYHSELNKAGGITIPAPSILEKFQLFHRQGEWDYYDKDQNLSTIYREFKTQNSDYTSHLLYLRADLLDSYLRETNQKLAWMIWGEREVSYKISTENNMQFQPLWSEYKHIHRQVRVYKEDKFNKVKN